MKKLIILVFFTSLLLSAPSGFAENITENIKTSIIDLVNAFQGIFFVIGSVIVAISIYKLFIDDNPQNRMGGGVSFFLYTLMLFSLGVLCLFCNKFIEWLFS